MIHVNGRDRCVFPCWALRQELLRNFVPILFLYTRFRIGSDKKFQTDQTKLPAIFLFFSYCRSGCLKFENGITGIFLRFEI